MCEQQSKHGQGRRDEPEKHIDRYHKLHRVRVSHSYVYLRTCCAFCADFNTCAALST